MGYSARKCAPRFRLLGDYESEERAEREVDSGEDHHHSQGIGQEPARPAIPSQVESAKDERQNDATAEQMQTQGLKSKPHDPIPGKSGDMLEPITVRIFHKVRGN